MSLEGDPIDVYGNMRKTRIYKPIDVQVLVSCLLCSNPCHYHMCIGLKKRSITDDLRSSHGNPPKNGSTDFPINGLMTILQYGYILATSSKEGGTVTQVSSRSRFVGK